MRGGGGLLRQPLYSQKALGSNGPTQLPCGTPGASPAETGPGSQGWKPFCQIGWEAGGVSQIVGTPTPHHQLADGTACPGESHGRGAGQVPQRPHPVPHQQPRWWLWQKGAWAGWAKDSPPHGTPYSVPPKSARRVLSGGCWKTPLARPCDFPWQWRRERERGSEEVGGWPGPSSWQGAHAR